MHLQPLNSTTKGFEMFSNFMQSKSSLFSLPHPFTHRPLLPQHPFSFYSSHSEALLYNRSFLANGPFQCPKVKIEQPEVNNYKGFQLFETHNIHSSTQVKIQEDSKANEMYYEQAKSLYQKRVHQMCAKLQLNESEMEEIKAYRKKRVTFYLGKKIKRTFQKKIVYDTRKRVADRRIRFKGKFINEHQARELLGLQTEEHSFQELKKMMLELKKQN